LTQVFAEANKLLESLEQIMSEDEYTFMKESLNSKAIPSPKLSYPETGSRAEVPKQ
jgi:hypothetical protein